MCFHFSYVQYIQVFQSRCCALLLNHSSHHCSTHEILKIFLQSLFSKLLIFGLALSMSMIPCHIKIWLKSLFLRNSFYCSVTPETIQIGLLMVVSLPKRSPIYKGFCEGDLSACYLLKLILLLLLPTSIIKLYIKVQ